MKKISSVIVLVALLACGLSASAQRGTEANKTVSVAPSVEAPSNVTSKGTVLKSGIKSLGTIGRTDRYEVVQFKVRGLDTPNLVGVFIYDSKNDEIIGQQSAAGPGIGAAIVNGGANVGASYLFGSKLRPDTTSVSAGNGTSVTANGGDGGSATGGNATGGNGNGGAGGSGGSGGSGGGGWVPPGHANGHPGNGPKK